MEENHNHDFVYENVISSLSDGVIVIGFDGKIGICNEAFCDALKLHIDKDSLVGTNLRMLMKACETNDEFFEVIVDAVFNKKRLTKVVPFNTKEGVRYLIVTTSLLMKGDEKIALIAVVTDRTDLVGLFNDNKKLAHQIIVTMNSFVEVLVTAIDEKSSYNANHTKNMVRYAGRYLKSIGKEDTPKIDSDRMDPFIMSIWLHDIGKILIPPEIMDKPTRLGDRLDDVLHKIEVTKLMIRIKVLQDDISLQEADRRNAELDEARELICNYNTEGFLNQEKLDDIKRISKLDCFDANGNIIPMFDDKEYESITVVRGTLTPEERAVIESHVSLTARLLSKMNFDGDYKMVPFWASTHHEMIDGSGYPDHLSGDQIPWETRLLSIIDIYDALTAEDRPYKSPMPPEKAFSVLRDMADKGRIDKDLLESFYESRAWEL